MDNFVFFNPTKVIFGRNVLGNIGKEASRHGKKALLVYGRSSIKNNGIYDACVSGLSKAGISVVEHGGVKPNPVLSHVRSGIQAAKENGCDIVIAAGGGSSIDEAKAIAAGARYDGDVWDFYCGKADIKAALPIITVLTLAATGSEMNQGSVITNEETRQKYSAHSAYLFPKVSFLDPQNTFSVPANQTAFGAVDAWSHLAEAYFTSPETSVNLQLELIEALMRNIIRSTAILMERPADYDARADMMWSATLALNGITASGMGGIGFINHAMEHSLSAIFDIPHGAGLAITTSAWFEYMKTRGLQERMARFGRNVMGINEKDDARAAAAASSAFRKWCEGMNVPVRLAQVGIKPDAIPQVTKNIMATLELWGITGYSDKDIDQILRLAA